MLASAAVLASGVPATASLVGGLSGSTAGGLGGGLGGGSGGGLGVAAGATPASGGGPEGRPIALESARPVAIQLSRIGPAALTAADRLVISGKIQATRRTPSTVRVRVVLHGTPLTSRKLVDDWVDGPDPASEGSAEAEGPTSVQVPVGDRVLPGAVRVRSMTTDRARPFTITVPRGGLALPDAPWAFGPRGVTVQVVSKGRLLGEQVSTVVWAPRNTVAATRLTLLAPITADAPQPDAGAATGSTAAALSPGGRLDRLLEAVSDLSFGWALDPAVPDAAQRVAATGGSGNSGSATPTASASPASASSPASAASPAGAGPSGNPAAGGPGTPNGTPAATPTASPDVTADAARAWLERLRQGLAGRDVLALPYADTDLSSVVNNSGRSLLQAADELGTRTAVDVLGRSVDGSVAWPGDGKVSGPGIRSLAAEGRTAVLLAAGNQPPQPAVTYTPSSRSVVQSKKSRLTGLLYDEQLSALLAASGALRSTPATQQLLAELAAISLERPADPRHLLAIAPRGWNPDPRAVRSMQQALAAAPWVRLQTFSELRRSPVGPARNSPVYQRSAAAAELPPGHISAGLALNRRLTTLAPALDPADPVLDPLRRRVVSLLSVTWRQDRDKLAAARQPVTREVLGLMDGVRLLVGDRQKVFTARSAPIPVSVRNSTAYPLTVVVQMRPQSGQLTMTRRVQVRVPPRTRQQVLIPSRAVAGGDVLVEGRLLSPAGRPLGGVSEFVVKVRPDWETWAITGMGSLLGLLLVLGLLRSWRRGRSRVRPQPPPDADDLAIRHDPVTGPIPLVTTPQQPGENS